MIDGLLPESHFCLPTAGQEDTMKSRGFTFGLQEFVMLPRENNFDAVEPMETIGSPASLAAILALIATDADQASAEYLEETVVPHGGE